MTGEGANQIGATGRAARGMLSLIRKKTPQEILEMIVRRQSIKRYVPPMKRFDIYAVSTRIRNTRPWQAFPRWVSFA